METVLFLLYVAAFFVIPAAVAWVIANTLRVKDYFPRLALIFFSIGMALCPFINQMVWKGGTPLDALSFAIDLAGGTNLVYEVKETPEYALSDSGMTNMVAAITKRINPSGTKEVVVRRVGRDRVEVIIPGANPAAVEDTKRQMTRLGSLDFFIVANRQDHDAIINRAALNPASSVKIDGKTLAVWRPIKPASLGQFISNPSFATRPSRSQKGVTELLLIGDPLSERHVSGKYLRRAFETFDQGGQLAVGFEFNSTGGQLFSLLTSQNLKRSDGSQRQLAIVLNNEVQTAPGIESAIGSSGIIHGVAPEEIPEQIAVLNSGALPYEINTNPISEFTISPTLGADVKSKGFLALWVSGLAVVIFMAVYYQVAGLVADFAMILNLLFIVSTMVLINAAFSLPGLAGLVLSAGMAVDANVLIYERIREETAKGASLRMAIHDGFDKAFSAIFDSNITTLMTAVILYVVGSEQVKGFAVSLFIGLVMNLFTAVWISRVILEVLERGRVVRKLNMLQWIGKTTFDFVGKQFIASVASLILITVGMAAFIARGSANYDIDFQGGSMISMQFNEKQEMDAVRKKLEEAFKSSNITVEELSSLQGGEDTAGRRFRLRVPKEDDGELDNAKNLQLINSAFPSQLQRISLNSFDVKEIAKAESESKDASKSDEKSAGISATDDPYGGGHSATLKFSEPVGPATIERYVVTELSNLGTFATPDKLLLVEGTAGPGLTAKESEVKLYDEMVVKFLSTVGKSEIEKVLAGVQSTLANSPLFDEVTTFDSSVASETKRDATLAVVASIIAILVYIWFRFENWVFGLAAVTALVHDVLVSLGMVALCSFLAGSPIGSALLFVDFKINMPMIAAFLTIVGYSLNDTIVIFDRLREVRGKNPEVTRDMINLTVNQTLSRTLLTAFTVFMSVFVLYALGGDGIHGFAFCMVVGSIAGTYSTVYIASPLVLYFMERAKRSQAAAASKPATPTKVAVP